MRALIAALLLAVTIGLVGCAPKEEAAPAGDKAAPAAEKPAEAPAK